VIELILGYSNLTRCSILHGKDEKSICDPLSCWHLSCMLNLSINVKPALRVSLMHWSNPSHVDIKASIVSRLLMIPNDLSYREDCLNVIAHHVECIDHLVFRMP
jgi:hypothetical protein